MLLIALPLIGAVGWWITTNLERKEIEIKVGYQGEAKANPLLAARRFIKGMGIPAETLPSLLQTQRLPPVDDTLVIATQRAAVVPQHHDLLLDWVNQGGHLILAARQADMSPAGTEIRDDLLNSLGISVYAAENDESSIEDITLLDIDLPQARDFLVIELSRFFSFRPKDINPDFVLEDEQGIYLIHARHGKGHVSVLCELGFISNGRIGKYDQAEFLWHLLHLAGAVNKVWLVHTEQMPPLWQWLWQHGWPLIIGLMLLLGAWLGVSMPRFGPLLPLPAPRRRRLLEHIEASGRFLWGQGQQRHLLNSVESALERRLLAHHPGWTTLSYPRREQLLAEFNQLAVQDIHALLHDSPTDDAQAFTRRIQLLESIRKKL
ncbi:MAG: DUF4350 domain-containing protein [Pseudomonadota bacterium]